MRVRELDARGHGGAAATAFLCRHGGRRHVVAVLKSTFTIVPGGVTTVAVPAVFDADEQLAPSRGAMRAIRPSDVSPPLPGAEVLVDASAFAPQGAPQGAVAVRLYVASRAGAIDKTLHVYGDRTASAPQPQPFERMPIVWERAIAGVSSDNPVGRPVGDALGLANVVNAQQAWVPAGLGPIAASWPARKRLLGEVDEPTVQQGELVVPDALPLAWFHSAPADQRIASFERELWLVLDGMHPTLPRLSTKLVFPEACARLRLSTGAVRALVVRLDRLFVEPERGLVTSTWRAWAPIDDDALEGLRVEAGLGPWPAPEALFDTDPASETIDSGSAQAALRAVLPWARGAAETVRAAPAGTTSRVGLPFAAPQQNGPTPTPGSFVPPAPTAAPLPRAMPAANTSPGDAAADHVRTPATLPPVRPPPPPSVAAAPWPSVAAPPRMPPSPGSSASSTFSGLPFVPAAASSAKRPAERPSTSGTPFGALAPVVPSATPHVDALDVRIDESTTEAPPSTPRAPAFVASALPPVEPPMGVELAGCIGDERTADVSSDAGLEFLSNDDPLAQTIAFVPSTVSTFGAAIPPPRTSSPAAVVGTMSLGSSLLGLRTSVDSATPLDDTTTDSASDPTPRPSVVGGASSRSLEAEAATPPVPTFVSTSPPVPEPSGLVRGEAHDANLGEDAVVAATGGRFGDDGVARDAPRVGADSSGVRALLLARVRERASVADLPLEGADLHGIDLRGADLRDAKLSRARLVGAKLDGASLVGAVLVEADLSSASLDRADLARADLSRATLRDASLERAVLDRARLVLAVLVRVRGRGLRADYAALEGVQADDACLAEASLQFVDLRGASLCRADLSEVVLVGADMTDVQASGARLDGATLTDVRASGATFSEGSAKGARAERSIWERAQLERSDWSDADLSESKLERAMATGANFTRARLREADLTAIVADDAQFVDAVIDRAELRQARLAGARATGISARGAIAPKLAAPGIFAERSDWSGATLRTAKLRGARFEDANLEGVDLRDADLVDADLRGALRASTKLGGASLRGAKRSDAEPPPNVD